MLPLLQSNDTPLSTGPLSLEEVSWVVAIGSIGCVVAAFTYPSITNRIGCKRLITSCIAIFSIVSLSHVSQKVTLLNVSFAYCRFRGHYSFLAERNMRFWSHDFFLVVLVLESTQPFYCLCRKSLMIGEYFLNQRIMFKSPSKNDSFQHSWSIGVYGIARTCYWGVTWSDSCYLL